MTAREAERIVRERYPDAVCKSFAGTAFTAYRIRAVPVEGVALGPPQFSRADAWKSAASRLTGE